MKCSKNAEARKLYEITTQKNITSESIINRATETDGVKKHKVKSISAKEIREENQLAVWNNFMGLKEQNVIIKFLFEINTLKDINR